MTGFIVDELVLYVTDVQTSVAFYSQILDQAPAANYGDFALFPLPGITIALQDKTQINPTPGPAVGGLELCFSQADRATVDRLHAEWAEAGIELALAPAEEDFGYTFVAVDPDGHRLRVCATRATAE